MRKKHRFLSAERRINHAKTFLSKPANVMLLIFGIALLGLTFVPLLSILREMFVVHVGVEKTLTGLKSGEFTLFHWTKLFGGGEWSKETFWKPLLNSFMVGFGGAVLGIGIGGSVAWLLARSNMKCKKIITSLFMFPYIMPAWTLALFWLNLFRNSKLGGGNVGIVESLFGVCMPQWFVYGLFPCIIVTGLHFAPFAYILIGGIPKTEKVIFDIAAQNLDADAELERVEIIGEGGSVLYTHFLTGYEAKLSLSVTEPGPYCFLKVRLKNGKFAATAPVWIEK